MDRIVRQIYPARRTEEVRPRYFSEYASHNNIVLLGDPGAGKSHLFQAFAGVEGGRYVTVRSFLATPVTDKGESLFIDGLDEKRAGRGDRDTVDALVGKLFEAGPSKVRLSCRAADWLGESDLASLKPFFEQSGGEPVVLHLATLNESECRVVLQAQGLASAEADAFLKESNDRGLREFLENPQNLLMLLRVVKSGRWPETRRELFELCTSLMLEEADTDHALKELGAMSAEELRPVAGATIAARLISDIDGIALTEQAGTSSVPGYRSIDFFNRSLVRAALTRRVFVAGPVSGSVDYAHRTTAEYLGAQWLADAVREGLPLLRVQALLGVDSQPAPELRGLHAWLAVHLPEHAQRIIDGDPYGVLTYGDAASLSPSNCAYLIKALGRLSQTDPWFHRGEWESPAIRALSRADMIEEFRNVLGSEDAGFGIRSVVLEALALGTPQPSLKYDIVAVVASLKTSYAERRYAVRALLRLGDAGKKELIDLYLNRLGARIDDLRLRVDILRALYGDPFTPEDVAALIDDVWSNPAELPGGVLWFLADALPLSDLPTILDGIRPHKRTEAVGRRNSWQIGNYFERILIKAWNELQEIEPARALRWLETLSGFRDSYSGGRDEFRMAIGAKPERLRSLADRFLEEIIPGDQRWIEFFQFQEMTLHLLGSDEMLALLLHHLAKAQPGTPKQQFLYEAAFSFAWHRDAQGGVSAFETLYELGDTDGSLRSIRDAAISAKLPDGYLKLKIGQHDREAKDEKGRERNRAQFDADVAAIRDGSHAGWLSFLAEIYYGMFSDLDGKVTPQQRLASIIGEANVPAAMGGLNAAIARSDVPGFQAIVHAAAKDEIYSWWRALLIAADEQFSIKHDLSVFSDDRLSALIALELIEPISEEGAQGPIWRVAAWKKAALEQRPALVHGAYKAIARVGLGKGAQYVDGLRELLAEPAFAPFRIATVLELLREFPNANAQWLDEMLEAMLATPEAHAGLLHLAGPIIDGEVSVDAQQYDQWLAVGYLLAPSRFEKMLEEAARARPKLIFYIRDFAGRRHGHGVQSVVLTLPELEFIAKLTGALYPSTSYPSDGWSGDTNPWDASEYFKALVNLISANPSDVAAQALARLERLPELASYKELLLNARARQRIRRQEAAYDRPDWPHTLRCLTKGPPATVADLYAVLIWHLDDVRAQLAHGNTDGFKVFWNLDSYSRPISPLPEETCRDRLVDLLRVRLLPLSVTVEPEGHMARDKRADISVAMPNRKILCELKRDYHSEVWTAAQEQLERFYAHDPDAQGFGLYVVFWFGEKRPVAIPPPPGGKTRPQSASEMEQMLTELIPPDRKERIAVRVIDVSGLI